MKSEPTEARCHIMTRSIGDGYGDEIMLREDAEEAVNRAFKEGQSSPKIKQLEWVSESGGWHISMTRFGVSYEIRESENDENFILYDILLTPTIHATIEAAKAAAQTDFEKRVMECLYL